MNQGITIKSIIIYMTAALALAVTGTLVFKAADKNKPVEIENSIITSLPPVNSTDHISGNASSTVTLIEYSDFECPACAYYFPMVEELLAAYKERIKFVYRHFPLPQHTQAKTAAYASEAAAMQGKFWEMYKKLFETQRDWAGEKDAVLLFADYAKELGLDVVKFRADMEDSNVKDKVNSDLSSGRVATVNSTPTFFVNQKKIANPRSLEEFKAAIDEALAQ